MDVHTILIIVGMISATGFTALGALAFMARRDASLMRRKQEQARF